MTRRREPLCLWIGCQDHYEWRTAILWLTEHLSFEHAATPTEILTQRAVLPAFDLIILAQSRPGEFSILDVEKVRSRWPTARVLSVVGNWSEGEARSGRPWPGVWRVPVSQFTLRLRDFLDREQVENKHPDRIVNREGPEQSRSVRRSRSWLLPQVISDSERLYYEAAEPLPSSQGTILIGATSQQSFEILASAIEQAEFSSIWHLPGKSIPMQPHAAIWDANQGTDGEWLAIRNFASSIRPSPLLVILGFPRSEDFARATSISAEVYGRPDRIAVLSKPYRLVDLCRNLVGIIGITDTNGPLDPAIANPKDSQGVPSATGYY